MGQGLYLQKQVSRKGTSAVRKSVFVSKQAQLLTHCVYWFSSTSNLQLALHAAMADFKQFFFAPVVTARWFHLLQRIVSLAKLFDFYNFLLLCSLHFRRQSVYLLTSSEFAMPISKFTLVHHSTVQSTQFFYSLRL